MTFQEMQDDMLKRIDNAYAGSTTYRALASVSFYESLKKVMLEMPENNFHGLIYKKASTNVSDYALDSIKVTELKDFVKLLSVRDNAKVKQYVYKTVSDFEDNLIKPITALQNFYTLKEMKIVFYNAIGSTETANILYLGIPAIGTSDDMGKYLNANALEIVIANALPNLRMSIMGAE